MPEQSLLSFLLAHHPPEAFDRCLFVAGRPICRRCAALYPLTFLVMALQFTPGRLPGNADPWLVGLAVPATLDFVLERLGRVRYHPARVVFGAMLLAIPLGRGFARYLQNPFDPWFWGMALGFGAPAFAAWAWRAWRDHRALSHGSEGEREDGNSQKDVSD